LVVTGAAGFIGSNFIHWMSWQHPEVDIVVVDNLTYAGNLANIEKFTDLIKFVRADIADPEAMREVLEGADGIINFAAESHVDRSIESAAPFLHSNIVGVQVILDLVKEDLQYEDIRKIIEEIFSSVWRGIKLIIGFPRAVRFCKGIL